MEFDLDNPLTSMQEHQFDNLPNLFASESDHMPSSDFLQCMNTFGFFASFRQEAFSLILQWQHSCNYDPLVPYLAVNYVDRFISRQEIPKWKPWVVRLLVTSCLSLAAKMKNIKFSVSNFQRDEGLVFDSETINRMELLILDALNWRMRSITPFSFVHFFVSLFELKDPPLKRALKDRATEIICQAHKEIRLLAFKPSIIAASALLVASHELFPLQFASFKCSICACEYVTNDELLKCYTAVQEMVDMEWYESMLGSVSSTRTPLSVLDQLSNRSESETTTTIIGTAMPMPAERRGIKRPKLNGS